MLFSNIYLHVERSIVTYDICNGVYKSFSTVIG
jgi:hypothetical protein